MAVQYWIHNCVKNTFFGVCSHFSQCYLSPERLALEHLPKLLKVSELVVLSNQYVSYLNDVPKTQVSSVVGA